LEKAGNTAKWESGEKESSCVKNPASGEAGCFWRSWITEVYIESNFWRGRIIRRASGKAREKW